MKRKSALWIFRNGNYSDLDLEHKVEIVQNMYEKKLAKAFFIGTGWVEGFGYCSNPSFLRKTGIPSLERDTLRPIWFACEFLDEDK